MWRPIKLTDRATGRSVYITILERELYLSDIFSFEDLWEIHRSLYEQLDYDCEGLGEQITIRIS